MKQTNKWPLFGAMVRAKLKLAGMTMSKLASLAGVTVAYVSDVCRGKKPSQGFVAKACSALIVEGAERAVWHAAAGFLDEETEMMLLRHPETWAGVRDYVIRRSQRAFDAEVSREEK